MHAGAQGQLSHLKILPQSDSTNLESYIYTALSFKNSLTALHICGNGPSYDYQLARSSPFQTLYEQIDQFKHLQRLHFHCQSDKYLSYFDVLIDKCHHLKELTFDLHIETTRQTDEPKPNIRPRPDIQTLTCNSKQINVKNQLEYIMRKFTNLESSKVSLERTVNEAAAPYCSGLTLIQFIQYVMSVPKFKLVINVDEKDLLNIWDEFMKKKNEYRNLRINFVILAFCTI